MTSIKARLPLRERNRQRVRRQILDAAFALFRSTGYDQTTMDAIAAHAEVSRGTLFNYFPTKSTLLIPFMQELYVREVQPELLPFLASQPTTLQALHFLFTSIYTHIFKFPDMDHALQALQQEVLHSPHSLHTHPAAKDINAGTGFLDNVQTILERGLLRDEVRTDIPLAQLVRYVGVLYLSLVADVCARQMYDTYSEDVDALLAFIGHALQPNVSSC